MYETNNVRHKSARVRKIYRASEGEKNLKENERKGERERESEKGGKVKSDKRQNFTTIPHIIVNGRELNLKI